MRFEELSSPAIDALDRETTVLLLPLGSVEQHGDHMPVGTDTMIVDALCHAVAEQRPGIVALPPPWYGYSPHHMRFAGTITLGLDTIRALVTDIVDSLVDHGFCRILIVNGHGGNGGPIDVLASTLGHAHRDRARIAALTYFQLAAAGIDAIRESGPGGTGHAGEFETSVLLHLLPGLIDMGRARGIYPDPGSAYLSTDITGSSPIRTYLDFADLSPNGVLGDPVMASAERGAAFFQAVVTELARFIEDFEQWKLPAT